MSLATLFLVLVVAIAACDEDDSSGGSGSSESARLVLLSAPPGDDFYYTIERSAKAEAERLGADLEVQQISKWEPDAQVPVLNAAIAKNPEAILINPVDTNALQAPLERAAQRGIKIITYDTTIRDPEGVIETYISGDIEKLGRTAAETQLELIDNRGKVFYQGTQPNQAFFDSLQRGWKEVIDKEPEVTQLPVVYSDWEPSKASSQMEAMLTAHPDLAGKVKLVGVDGAPQNVQRLKDGALSAIVSVKAVDYGSASVRAAVQAIKGEKLPTKTVMGQCVLTSETLDDPENKDCLYDTAPAS
jgi:ribose transport system substrate-binding protein